MVLLQSDHSPRAALDYRPVAGLFRPRRTLARVAHGENATHEGFVDEGASRIDEILDLEVTIEIGGDGANHQS